MRDLGVWHSILTRPLLLLRNKTIIAEVSLRILPNFSTSHFRLFRVIFNKDSWPLLVEIKVLEFNFYPPQKWVKRFVLVIHVTAMNSFSIQVVDYFPGRSFGHILNFKLQCSRQAVLNFPKYFRL